MLFTVSFNFNLHHSPSSCRPPPSVTTIYHCYHHHPHATSLTTVYHRCLHHHHPATSLTTIIILLLPPPSPSSYHIRQNVTTVYLLLLSLFFLTMLKIKKEMKVVTMTKVWRAQEAVVNPCPFSKTLVEVLYNFKEQFQMEHVDVPLTKVRPVKKVSLVFIFVTGNSDLCGDFNNHFIKKAKAGIKKLKNIDLDYIVVSVMGRMMMMMMMMMVVVVVEGEYDDSGQWWWQKVNLTVVVNKIGGDERIE